MHFLQAIKSDLSVLIVCNKTGGTIKGDIKIDKALYVFRTGPLSIIRIISTMYTRNRYLSC